VAVDGLDVAVVVRRKREMDVSGQGVSVDGAFTAEMKAVLPHGAVALMPEARVSTRWRATVVPDADLTVERVCPETCPQLGKSDPAEARSTSPNLALASQKDLQIAIF
jgi:hypothetical protein